ncbi:MAG: hypothetical protein VB131_03065 [Burkholderia gladioli]
MRCAAGQREGAAAPAASRLDRRASGLGGAVKSGRGQTRRAAAVNGKGIDRLVGRAFDPVSRRRIRQSRGRT